MATDIVKLDQQWTTSDPKIEFLEQIPDPAIKERSGTDNPFAEITRDGEVFPELVDWDGDGDVDLLLGTQKGSVRFLERQADGTLK